MKKENGFTLIELLAVVLIIGTLTAVALPQYNRLVEKAKVTEAISLLRSIYDSSERLASELGYKDYSDLLISETDNTKYSFPRFDIFDTENMPAGCAIKDNTTLYCGCPNPAAWNNAQWSNCKFVYKITKDYVLAKKNHGTKYLGTIIGLDKSNTSIYCYSSDTNACDVFGLDERSLSF